MDNTIDRKLLGTVTRLYSAIVIVVNFIGYLMATSGGMPITETENYIIWSKFMYDNKTLTSVLSICSFIIPTIIIVIYSINMFRKHNERILNLPFVYAALGTLGWLFSFFMELICLLIAKKQYNIEITEIVFVSLLNILQESICIFTLAFLIMNFIHRKWALPKLFPNGNLSRFNNGMRPSVRFLVVVFYFSVCIFPIFFMTSSMISIIRNNGIKIQPTIFILLGIILVFSGIILWTFCDYFTNPLSKLKIGVQKIKAGDYKHHMDIVSSDDFGELSDAFNDMTTALDEKNKKIYAIQNSIIKGMAVMVESRDNSTGGHISRTSDCVKVFVEKLIQTDKGSELSPEFCKAVIKAAPMHDLGKIAVDDAILRKPGKFTDDEYEIMKTHSAEGARIVQSVLAQVDDEQFKQIAINVAHYHHEKWNGTGYPEKISGENIPLEARIMALADVFDALVSKRCYKESMGYDKAFRIIEESLGSHFDPELGRVFIESRMELEKLYDGYNAIEL